MKLEEMTKEELIEQLKSERNYHTYEINKYEHMLADKETGIAEEFFNAIKLELEALNDIAKFLPEDDARHITRRVNRIINILEE